MCEWRWKMSFLPGVSVKISAGVDVRLRSNDKHKTENGKKRTVFQTDSNGQSHRCKTTPYARNRRPYDDLIRRYFDRVKYSMYYWKIIDVARSRVPAGSEAIGRRGIHKTCFGTNPVNDDPGGQTSDNRKCPRVRVSTRLG